MQVIPAIDLLNGRCVRLHKGDFAQAVEYPEDPLQLGASYQAVGLDRLHLVDLDGARSGTPANGPIITRLTAELGMHVQVGGGIRDLARARTLLAAGASRIIIGSVAAETPEVALDWLSELGPEQMILAFDVRHAADGEPMVLTRGWTHSSGLSLWHLLERFVPAGDVEFLCTDIERDGTLAGPNLALYRHCCERFPGAHFIASGGVSCAADLAPLAATGVESVVTGKALLDGRLSLQEIGQFLRGA